MPKVQKKFGAFSGVFTPSILTILGVIMYMRLGWVVGEAGIIAALVIIAIAHIISFTTGLSVSSIATDKKIKAGGIYYILSRSLGLPMGGTIGIALFVGTALSISMYIIGFVENFLSIKVISDFLGMTPGVDSYRIVGSIVLLFLTLIAFISTSLAIKSQYIILTAIGLSLVSIFAGFFIHTDLYPVAPLFSPANDTVSFEYVFSIFFPAVTGFTAGVAMSGDLKNPKKDIPIGTIAAIFTGFVVYVLLALGYGFYVKRELLLTDFNIAIKIAWYSPFVIAGVWGATLSSALGGILGGPRILQATSKDGITPKVFGKGYGINNEPRNALLFIAIIAEAGILIGNLNVIAGIVTMFYLTSYGFINLAYVLESWASSDFRPSFKIPRSVAITGFLFAFAIMFKIDVVSMIAAFILMGLLYLILQRRQLRLDYGDVWQSVWINIIRKGLQKINTSTFEERNWQPNIILFSGGTEHRPHLIEFGKSLVGKFGVLTNFDLIETQDSSVLFPKHKQKVVDKSLLKQGIFMRRQSCRDIYEGIEMIVRTYGFAGLEPNTVVMGWGRQSKNPERFVKLIDTINDLDYNILLIDYDKRYGYGNKQVIDIWWRGGGNNGNLALAIAKFMKNSEEWFGAKIRLLVVNYENKKASYIYKKIDHILDNLRIDAEIKIINNEIEQKPVYDIIRQESANSDIVFLGIPEIEKGKEGEFVEKTNKLLHDIGTVVLIKASSLFKELNLGINEFQESLITGQIADESKNKPKQLPEEILLNEKLSDFVKNIETLISDNIFPIANKTSEETGEIFSEIKSFLTQVFNNINNAVLQSNSPVSKKTASIISFHKKISLEANKQLDKLQNKLEEDEEFYTGIITNLTTEIESIRKKLPEKYEISISETEVNKHFPRKNLKYLRFRLKSKKDKNGFTVKLNLKKLARKNKGITYKYALDILEAIARKYTTYLIKFQNAVKDNENSLSLLRNELYKDIEPQQIYVTESIKITSDEIRDDITGEVYSITENFINSLTSFDVIFKEKLPHKDIKNTLNAVSSKFISNTALMINGLKMEILLNYADAAYNHNLKLLNYELSKQVKNEAVNVIENLKNKIGDTLQNGEFEYSLQLDTAEKEKTIRNHISSVKNKIKKIPAVFPSQIEIINDEDYNNYFDKIFDDLSVVNTKMETLVEYLFEEKTYTDLEKTGDLFIETYKLASSKEKEAYRLMLFAIQNNTSREKLKEIVGDLIKKLDKEEIYEKFEQAQSIIFEDITTVSSKLTLYSLLKIALNFKTYVRKIEKEKKTSKIKKVLKKRESFFIQQYVKLKYGKAFHIDKAFHSDNEEEVYATELLKIYDRLTPNKPVIKALPFYYYQIFTSGNVHYKDFCAGRENEYERIKKAINYYTQGYKGAILITGHRYSGKSMLAHITASEYAGKDNVFVINPPEGGSISLQKFRNALFDAFQHKDALEGTNFLGDYDKKTTIIIEDIEMWWAHYPGSTAVINEIVKMIETFGDRILFVLTSSSDSFEILKNITSINSVLLDRINLPQLKPEVLKNIVYLRHDTTDVKFTYKGKPQEELSITQEAELFVKLFDLSAGIPGLTLYYWLSSIAGVKEKNIKIDVPKSPSIEIFDNLNDNHIFILLKLIYHKSLSVETLKRYVNESTFDLDKTLEFLILNSLITKKNNIVAINKTWYIFIYEFLKKRNLI